MTNENHSNNEPVYVVTDAQTGERVQLCNTPFLVDKSIITPVKSFVAPDAVLDQVRNSYDLNLLREYHLRLMSDLLTNESLKDLERREILAKEKVMWRRDLLKAGFIQDRAVAGQRVLEVKAAQEAQMQAMMAEFAG